MTVIAYRNGIMAADTMITIGVKLNCRSKIHVKDKHLLAVSGDSCPPDQMILDWYKPSAKKLPALTGFHFSMLVIPPKGHMQLWDANGGCEPLTLPFFAIGAGSEFAMGAMSAGASARKAVAIAIKWSENCGGKITTMRRF